MMKLLYGVLDQEAGVRFVIQCITINWHGARDCHIYVIPRTNMPLYYIWSHHWQSNPELIVTKPIYLLMRHIIVMYDRRGSRVAKMTGGLTYRQTTQVEACNTKWSFAGYIIHVTRDILFIITMHISSVQDKSY